MGTLASILDSANVYLPIDVVDACRHIAEQRREMLPQRIQDGAALTKWIRVKGQKAQNESEAEK